MEGMLSMDGMLGGIQRINDMIVPRYRPHGVYSLDNPLMLGYGAHGEPDSDDYFTYADCD